MHNRIRIARGNVSTAPNDVKAEKGVPFYDTTNKRLYIGKDNTTPINQYTKNESPIAFEADNVTTTIGSINIKGDAGIFYDNGKTPRTCIMASSGSNRSYEGLEDFEGMVSVTDEDGRATGGYIDKLYRCISSPIVLQHSNSFTDQSVSIDGDEFIQFQVQVDGALSIDGNKAGKATYTFMFDSNKTEMYFPINQMGFNFETSPQRFLLEMTVLKVSKVSTGMVTKPQLKFEIVLPYSSGGSGVTLTKPWSWISISPMNTSSTNAQVSYGSGTTATTFTITNIWRFKRRKAA